MDTGTDTLLCSLVDGVATVTLNRPEKRNALSDELTPALRETLLILDTHPEVRCVVLTGAGNAFCAGGDISGMGSGRSNDSAQSQESSRPSIQDAAMNLLQRQETLTLRLHQLSKPTIAALPGAAAGAGMSIALACDIRIASRSAFITSAFANIGLSGDYGGSWFLTRIVGSAKAKELFFTAQRVYGEEGLSLGLFNRVVDDDQLQNQAQELALQIASGPPIAIQYMKENLNRAIDCDLTTSLQIEADRMVRCTRTEDHKEAVKAFMEKRSPDFQGQ
jgi:2-(1,2-epoxy-1,2-dihydrophenyl)acetyl-CoA isomerase